MRGIIDRLGKAHPDAKLALDFETPFELLIALILAAQCTDERVNEVTRQLFARYRTPEDYVRETPENLEEAIRPTGFFRQKTKAIRACCSNLIDRFGGRVPGDLAELLSLPGVGRKTANILRGNGFGIPAIGVDTHVARLSQRLGLSRHQDPDKIEADLVQIVPERQQVRFCHLLQFHGRRVCVARKPRCFECAVEPLCPFPNKTPAPGKPPAPTGSRWIGKRPRRRG